MSRGTDPQILLTDAHTKTINDCKFSNLNENIFGTVSDDGYFKIWDKRDMRNGQFV